MPVRREFLESIANEVSRSPFYGGPISLGLAEAKSSLRGWLLKDVLMNATPTIMECVIYTHAKWSMTSVGMDQQDVHS